MGLGAELLGALVMCVKLFVTNDIFPVHCIEAEPWFGLPSAALRHVFLEELFVVGHRYHAARLRVLLTLLLLVLLVLMLPISGIRSDHRIFIEVHKFIFDIT